jgi:hypothetical protein
LTPEETRREKDSWMVAIFRIINVAITKIDVSCSGKFQGIRFEQGKLVSRFY